MPRPRRTLRSKFIVAASIGVLAGLALSAAVAVGGGARLRERSSAEVERGLDESSHAQLVTQIEVVRGDIERLIGPAGSTLSAMTDTGQTIIDHDVVFSKTPPGSLLEVDAVGRRRVAGDGSSTSIGAWSYLLDANGTLKPEVADDLSRTALLELVVPPLRANGTSVLQAYQVGPRAMPFLRMAPDYPLNATMERLYPGSTSSNFWEFFFPGMVDTWEAMVNAPGDLVARTRRPVFTAPYEDAGGGGVVVSMFRPLWSKDRRALRGAIGIDVALSEIIRTIQGVRTSKSGFAFLVDSEGDVLAINEAGAAVLGLKSGGNEETQGVKLVSRKLEESTVPSVAALKRTLPADDVVHSSVIAIAGSDHVVVLRRYASLDTWVGEKGFRERHWTIGLVVPKDEIFATLASSRRVIADTSASILALQGGITLATLVAVVLGLAYVARRMTAPLTALTEAARSLEERRYEVDVPDTNDEVGELATAFGAMATKIRAHTEHLEQSVKERTEELNRTLADLWSEMDLAQKIQTVLLPEDTTLGRYEIAARMVPASAVGGDYYDFFEHGGSTWAFVGDVSGHGVTAGLIMMMAQTAARTAVIGAPPGSPPAPSTVLAAMNRAIRGNLERIGKGQYMTITAMRIDGAEVRYAGLHQDILVYRADEDAVDVLPTSGLWLGLVDDVAPLLEDAVFSLAPGDALVLHTDGVTEAKVGDRRVELEGLSRAFSTAARTMHAPEIVAEVFGRLGIETFADDATLVVIKRTKAEPA